VQHHGKKARERAQLEQPALATNKQTNRQTTNSQANSQTEGSEKLSQHIRRAAK